MENVEIKTKGLRQKHEISDMFPLPLQEEIKRRIMRSSREQIEKFGRKFLNFRYGKIAVYGKIPAGKVVLVPNHVHLFDSVSIKALDADVFENSELRDIVFVSKIEHQQEPMLEPLFEKFKTIFIDRDKIRTEYKLQRKFLKESREVLNSGAVYAIFTEGTRNGMAKGKEIYSGAITVADMNDASIVPVRFIGNFKFFSINTLIKRILNKNIIKIVFGDPINPKELLNGRTKEEASKYLMKDIVMNLQVPEEKGIQRQKSA